MGKGELLHSILHTTIRDTASAIVSLGYNTRSLFQSGGRLNVAIQGLGFFLLQDPSNSGHILTRSSDFMLGSDGTLLDIFGRCVMGYKKGSSTLEPIKINSQLIDDVGFENGGWLVTNYRARRAAREAGEVVPAGEELFQIGLGSVPNPEQLDGHTGNAFKVSRRSGEISFGAAVGVNFGTILGAQREISNFNPAETTIKGIQAEQKFNAINSALTVVKTLLDEIMKIPGRRLATRSVTDME